MADFVDNSLKSRDGTLVVQEICEQREAFLIQEMPLFTSCVTYL